MWIKGRMGGEIPVLVNSNTIQSFRRDGVHVFCDLSGEDAIEIGCYKTPSEADRAMDLIENKLNSVSPFGVFELPIVGGRPNNE